MLCRVSVGPYRIVARSNDRLAPFVDDQRAERMAPVFARRSRQLNRLSQKSQVLFRYLFHC